MTPINPALIIAGPAIVQHKGKTFYSKDTIVANWKLEQFDILTSRVGKAEGREANLSLELRFTPVGTFDALSVLWPYGARVPGDLLQISKTMGAVSAGANTITITAHGFRNGEQARVATYGTLPAPLAAGTLYYIGVVDADTIKLYLSEANALAATSPVDITDIGTGVHRIIEQPYLVIQSVNGEKYTFHNAAVTAQPDFIAGAVETPIGQVTFECFRQFGLAPTNAASFYTPASAAFTDTSFDPANIITQAYLLAWGVTAPWSSMSTKSGAKISFGLDLAPVTDDAGGILTRRINNITAQCVARPNNIDEATFWTKRTVQGAGAGRGRRIVGTNLDISSTDSSPLYIRIYGADIIAGENNWDRAEERQGEITWAANRTFTAGVPNPVYAISTTVIP